MLEIQIYSTRLDTSPVGVIDSPLEVRVFSIPKKTHKLVVRKRNAYTLSAFRYCLLYEGLVPIPMQFNEFQINGLANSES